MIHAILVVFAAFLTGAAAVLVVVAFVTRR